MAFLVSEEASTLQALFEEGIYLIKESKSISKTAPDNAAPSLKMMGSCSKNILFWYAEGNNLDQEMPLLEKILAASGLTKNDIGILIANCSLDVICDQFHIQKLIVMGAVPALADEKSYTLSQRAKLSLFKSETLASMGNDVAKKTLFWNTFKQLIHD